MPRPLTRPDHPQQTISAPVRLGDGMSATTYYAMSAEEQLAEAQRTLDTHITSSANGRCLACGVHGPCHKREGAVTVFSRTLRLPSRRPGATRPELVNARRVGVPALLAAR